MPELPDIIRHRLIEIKRTMTGHMNRCDRLSSEADRHDDELYAMAYRSLKTESKEILAEIVDLWTDLERGGKE